MHKDGWKLEEFNREMVMGGILSRENNVNRNRGGNDCPESQMGPYR